MLVALFVLLLSGSSGTLPMTEYLDHAREYAKSELNDPAQRAAVLKTLDDMKKAQSEFHKVEEEAAKTLAALADNPSSKSADFQPAFAALRTDSSELQEKLVQLRFRLKSQVTREHWTAAHRSQ